MKFKNYLKISQIFHFKYFPVKILAGIFFLTPINLNAQTTFKVQLDKGYWSVASASQFLPYISSKLNGKNILLNAKPASSGFHTIIDGLEVKTQFKVKDGKWAQMAVSVHNPLHQIPCTSIHLNQ